MTDMTPEDMESIANEFASEQANHQISLGDICKVSANGGRDTGKTVIVISKVISTKKGPRQKAVEESKQNDENPFILWLEPNGLTYLGRTNVEAAKRIADADFAAWKAKNPR